MPTFAILLLCIVPLLIMLIAVVVVLRTQLQAHERERNAQLTLENRKITLPIRLQAYERIALYLERISPEALLLRIPTADHNAKAYESVLLETSRNEWNHNLSQQIYLSPHVWGEVKSARGNVTKFIQLCAERVRPDAPAGELASVLLAALLELSTHPTARALGVLQQEAATLF